MRWIGKLESRLREAGCVELTCGDQKQQVSAASQAGKEGGGCVVQFAGKPCVWASRELCSTG